MKRFYNNTLIGGAFSKALRVVALLCVLLGFSSSAWGATYYLWQGTADNYGQMNTKMSAELSNNTCTWTSVSLKSGDNFFYIGSSTNLNDLFSTEQQIK